LAKDAPPPSDRRPIRHLIRRLIGAPTVLAIVWPALLLCVGYAAWHRWGAEHFARRYFGIDVRQIEVTPPPEEIRSKVGDLVRQVYEETALDQLSLLDASASSKIASAFSINPWVRQVVSVRKLPEGRVDVRLAYRRPVAMVYIECENGFFAVDGEGMLLPDKDFSPGDTERYVHIVVADYCPKGNQLYPGQPLGDHRIEAAARLAEYLMPYLQSNRIRLIRITGDPRQSPRPQMEVLEGDRDDLARYYRGDENALLRFFWGSAPGSELPGEDTAAMKVQRLISGASPGSDLRMASPPGRSLQ